MDDKVQVVLINRRIGSPRPYEAPSGRVHMIYRGVENWIPVEDADGVENYETTYWCMRQNGWVTVKPFKIIL